MRRNTKKLLMKIFLVAFSIGILFLLTWFFKLLWNYVMPRIFGITEISFWMSFVMIFFIAFAISMIKLFKYIFFKGLGVK